MNYHNITKEDMLNGDGLRTVLWVSGCGHHCKGCQNPQTHDPESGIPFDDSAKAELFGYLEKNYCSGLTLSGGDPLFPPNREEATKISKEFKEKFPNKTLWIYTGYDWEDVKDLEIMQYADVVVDGRFVLDLADTQYKWAGSINQTVIDVKKSLESNSIVRKADR